MIGRKDCVSDVYSFCLWCSLVGCFVLSGQLCGLAVTFRVFDPWLWGHERSLQKLLKKSPCTEGERMQDVKYTNLLLMISYCVRYPQARGVRSYPERAGFGCGSHTGVYWKLKFKWLSRWNPLRLHCARVFVIFRWFSRCLEGVFSLVVLAPQK